MGRRLSDNQRMSRAVNEAAQLHDGAYKDPTAMEMIAKNYKVNLQEFTLKTNKEVELRLWENELLNKQLVSCCL